jgi:hypothetical protein
VCSFMIGKTFALDLSSGLLTGRNDEETNCDIYSLYIVEHSLLDILHLRFSHRDRTMYDS